jgi:hypothetical protein
VTSNGERRETDGNERNPESPPTINPVCSRGRRDKYDAAPEFPAPALLALAERINQIPGSLFVAGHNGRKNTATSRYAFVSRRDRPADLDGLRTGIIVSIDRVSIHRDA